MNADEPDFISFSLYCGPRHRMDVYIREEYHLPMNARYSAGDTGDILYIRGPENDLEYFTKLYKAYPNREGLNVYSSHARTLSLTIKGHVTVEIKETEVALIELEVGSVNEFDFFDDDLILHLALILGIPSSNIRIVEAVSENSRRRRDVSTQYQRYNHTDANMIYLIEIGQNPPMMLEKKETTFSTMNDKTEDGTYTTKLTYNCVLQYN